MTGHQPLERRILIVCVVVHMHAGVPRQARTHEVHKIHERLPFLCAGVCPEALEFWPALFKVVDAKQIFQSSHLHGVALHVKEQVSWVGRRKTQESACLIQRDR